MKILAELMVQVAPSLYRKYVTTNAKGKAVLYVQLEKAVYCMMKSALLFYRKLVADLTSLGYEINPYDPCAANKLINGNQMTICWHVDDLLIGHVDSSVVTTFLAWLASRYDTANKKLNVTRGSRHDYLGMNIDFSDPVSIAFDMIPYISKIITGFPEKITRVSSTPAADYLFNVRPQHEASFLPEEQARSFHHTTAQLLCLSRVRRDIQPTIAFLITRVKQPDEDNWVKLKKNFSSISIPLANCASPFLTTLSPLSIGTLMHPNKRTMIARVIQGPFSHLARVPQQAHRLSTKYLPKVQLRVKSSVFMIRQVTFSGQGIS
jgi:hypothetical protein